MVTHPDPEILVLQALGDPAGDTPGDDHVQTCPQCRGELARLIQVVGVARQAGPEQLDQPPPQVWERIAAAVGDGQGPLLADRGQDPVPVDGGRGSVPADPGRAAASAGPGENVPARARRRRRLTAALAGLAAGLIIGIGGTAGIAHLAASPAPRVIAQVQLSPLPQFPQWRGAAGTAVMRATGGQPVIAVTLQAPQRPGFYEVWLLARNGVSMISLGDLNASHTGTFTVPPGTDLRNYSRIDVSLQPFDGSTVHVKQSVVRGSLPAMAYTAAGRF